MKPAEVPLYSTAELARYLPHLTISPRTPAARPERPPLPSFSTLLPRSTTAVVITMSAALLNDSPDGLEFRAPQGLILISLAERPLNAGIIGVSDFNGDR